MLAFCSNVQELEAGSVLATDFRPCLCFDLLWICEQLPLAGPIYGRLSVFGRCFQAGMQV